MPVIPALRRQKQEDHKFKTKFQANPGYKAKSCSQTNKQANKQSNDGHK
jgi:hypothetical protein